MQSAFPWWMSIFIHIWNSALLSLHNTEPIFFSRLKLFSLLCSSDDIVTMLQDVLLWNLGTYSSLHLSEQTDSGYRCINIVHERKTQWALHTFNMGTICHTWNVQNIFVLQPCILQHVSFNWSGSFCPLLQTSDVVHRNLVDTVIHMFSSGGGDSDCDVRWAGRPMRWDHHDQYISIARAHSRSRVTLRLISCKKWPAAVIEAVDTQISPAYLDNCWMLFSSEHT